MHTIVQEMMIDYSPIWISFKCAAFSIFITFFLGLFAARWMMTLKNKVIQLIFDGIFTLPLVLPPTVMGFFLLLIFGVNASGQNLFAPAFGYGNDYLNPSSTDKQTQIRVFYID